MVFQSMEELLGICLSGDQHVDEETFKVFVIRRQTMLMNRFA